VHVDPLPLRAAGRCVDEAMSDCGGPAGSSYQQRSEDLVWLSDTWVAAGRTADLELGPELSLAWADDPDATAAIAADLEEKGGVHGPVTDGAALVAETNAALRDGLGRMLAAGAASIGAHTHGQLPDGPGRWGQARKVKLDGEPEACAAWEGDPLIDPTPAMTEAVVAYAATSAALLAGALDAPLLSYTGHFPRTMTGKIDVVEAPDRLDPDGVTAFPDAFQPLGLGSAYSECMHPVSDTPPFELWPADADRALGAGVGPLVTPGERVVGLMDEHLDVYADTAAPAAQRRAIELFVNWRYAALQGDADRAWAWTYHIHDYQLRPGEPDARAEAARQSSPTGGSAFRGDVEAVAELFDEFAARSSWQGASATEGGVFRWALPEDVAELGGGVESSFDFRREGEAPDVALPTPAWPYLDLLARSLVDSHLACRGQIIGGAEVFGFDRCLAGWRWGGEKSGYHCAEGQSPSRIYLVVPDGDADCLYLPYDAALQTAPVDGEALGTPERCGGGVAVPEQGLLAAASDPTWALLCPSLE
jgi:hypothetical protein